MTQLPMSEKTGGDVYQVPQFQPSLSAGADGRLFIEDELRGKAAKAGKEERFNILLKALGSKEDFKQRTLEILKRIPDDEAFLVTLDTLAYARRSDPNPSTYGDYKHALRRVERCIEDGVLPLKKMKDLMEVGLVFNTINFHHTDITIQKERNWVNGGERSLDGRIDVDFPPKDVIIRSLNALQLFQVHVNGREVPLNEVSESVLRGVYASRVRSQRSKERKALRFLTATDW
jgi:hypothetical protein